MNEIKVLIIMTSHAVMGDTGEPTGVWLEELATPYYAFVDAGFSVDLASIRGGSVPIDPRSRRAEGENEPSVERFLTDTAALRAIESSLELSAIDIDDYDALLLPGGHGTMWDFPASKALAELVSSMMQRDAVVAAVCHGPAGLVSARTVDGQSVVSGRRVSAFSNSEEVQAGLTDVVPFLLETRLKELGANVQTGPDFEPFAVRDGNLITGQNPASSKDVAELVIEALSVPKQRRASVQ